MKALLLAAGLGSRLRPITETMPKCMVSVMGRPLLDYWLEMLGPTESCSEIIINTHYLPELVAKHVDASPYRNKITLVHENTLLGTGGTLVKQLARLEGEDTLVAHADNLSLFRLDEFKRAFESRPLGCVGTMMTFQTDNASSCGIAEIDSKGILQAFYEKVLDPPSTLANAAIFYFGRAAFDIIENLPSDGAFEISRVIIPRLLGRLNTWENVVYHRDIGTPEALRSAQTDFPEKYLRFRSEK